MIKRTILITTMHTTRRRRKSGRQGFTLIEVMFASIIFLMMALMFAAVVPMSVRAAKFGNNYSQAAMLAQHKIDQLRAVGIGKIDYADLSTASIIDTMATPPSPDTTPYTFTFNTVDNVVSTGANTGYFPAGSTGGTISVVDYNAYQISKGVATPSVPAGVMDFITVTIAWSGGGVSSGTYSASAVIVKMAHT